MRIWEDKEENDILECIVEAWHNLGCQRIVNLHKHDRRHEGGADLACQENGKKVDLQAKMKPRQKDIKQLEALSRSAADRKIYVYASQPSKPFMNQMAKLDGLVDFWDSNKLHSFLVSNRCQLYLRYMFLDCDLFRNIEDILIRIFASSKIKPLPLDSSILEDWWDLKDRTVKLHANLEHLEFYWKDKLLSQVEHDSVVLGKLLGEIFLSFSIISKNCSKDLLDLVIRINDRQPNVFSYYVSRVLKSSPWMGMGQLKNKIDCTKEAKTIIQDWVLPMPLQKYGSEYSLISSFLQDLHQSSKAVEDGVDFVFYDFVKK